MFAAKQGFYTVTNLGPNTDYWVGVFDDFIPQGIDNSQIYGNGDIFLAGRTSTGGQKGSIIRLDQQANIIWQTTTSGAVNQYSKIAVGATSFTYVIGSTNENGTTRPYAAKYGPAGFLQWEKYISDVTNGVFNDLIFDTTTLTNYSLSTVGRSNSTAASQFMSFDIFNGALFNQSNYGSTEQTVYSICGGGSLGDTVYHAGLNTIPATDDVRITKMNNPNDYIPANQINISDASVNLTNPQIARLVGGRLVLTTRYPSGTFGGQSAYVVLNGTTLAIQDQSRLGGTITSSGMQLSTRQKGDNNYGVFGAATQTNNTVWVGGFASAGFSLANQRNFYFGTIGTNTTDVEGVSFNSESSTPAVYIIGQTNYYGASKGYIAKLPIGGAVPGTGVYGPSNEIHLATSSYMSMISTSNLSATVGATTVNNTGFTNTTSALTSGSGTSSITTTFLN